MFRLELATYSDVRADNTYGQNLLRAALVFLAALMAVAPADEKISAPVSEKTRMAGIDQMLSLARQFELTQPNQAAELRNLAGSDILLKPTK